MKNNLGLFLAKRAFLGPDVEAYVDSHSDLRLTFGELNGRANRVANALLADGIEKGERVGLLLMNGAEFMEAYFALAKVGAVVVPLNWRLVADELEFILKDSGTRRLIYDGDFAETVADLHARGDKTDVAQWLQVTGGGDGAHFAQSYERFRDAASSDEPESRGSDEDMLYIMYTSGTTGLPKGVVHTHTSSIWAVLTIAATCAVSGWRSLSRRPADVSRWRSDTAGGQRLRGCHFDCHAQLRSGPGLGADRAGAHHHRPGGTGNVELHGPGRRLRTSL